MFVKLIFKFQLDLEFSIKRWIKKINCKSLFFSTVYFNAFSFYLKVFDVNETTGACCDYRYQYKVKSLLCNARVYFFDLVNCKTTRFYSVYECIHICMSLHCVWMHIHTCNHSIFEVGGYQESLSFIRLVRSDNLSYCHLHMQNFPFH